MTEPFKVPEYVTYHGFTWQVTRKNENQVTLSVIGFNNQPKLTWGIRALEMAINERRMEVGRQ